jgi:hypothetical protein
MELIDEVFQQLHVKGVRSLGCVVDLELGQLIPEFPLSPNTPIGAASRRSVADYLAIPMSGFRLPQFLLLDRSGCRRRRCVAAGETFPELIQSLVRPVEELLNDDCTRVRAKSSQVGENQ